MSHHFHENFFKISLDSLSKLILISDIEDVHLIVKNAKGADDTFKLVIKMAPRTSSALKSIFGQYMSFNSIGIELTDYNYRSEFFVSLMQKVCNYSVKVVNTITTKDKLLQYINYMTSVRVETKRQKKFFKNLFAFSGFIVCYDILIVSNIANANNHTYRSGYYDSSIINMIRDSDEFDFSEINNDILKNYYSSGQEMYNLTPITQINFNKMFISRKGKGKHYEYIDKMLEDCVLYKLLDEVN